MNLSVLVWIGMVVVLSGLAFRRPAYGVSLYMFTFFITPMYWWWGDIVEGYRWNLFAAVILFGSVLLKTNHARSDLNGPSKFMALIAILMAVNALFVHFVLAVDRELSSTLMILLLKIVMLHFVMVAAIRTPADVRIVLWSIVLFASYIGYEATINDRGRFIAGRLEGIGAAGVRNANELASLLGAVIPLGGYLFLTGKPLEKIVAAFATALSLNMVLLCSSRGTFLGLIAAAIIILTMAPKGVRKTVLKGLALGSVALILLLRDPDIVARFMTIFVSAEERDNSAAGRLDIWRAALKQIADYPLGAGGESFSRALGRTYFGRGRSVHNGYLNEMCNWGLQGFALRMAFLTTALLLVRNSGRQSARASNQNESLLAACLMSAMAGTLVTALFGDYLDDEWLVWLAALICVQSRVLGAIPTGATEETRRSVGAGATPASAAAK